MPQQGLPFPTSNNAPLPIPGGYGNPTGANTGGYGGASNNPYTAFNFPAYGSPVQGVGGAGGPAYNVGPYNATNLGGLNAGLMAYGQGYGTQLYNDLGKAYGKGTGQLLGNLLSGQLYNPAVAAAYLNAQQPGIAQGQASILGAFGDAGARFSSAAGVGLGNYNSQVQLNQQQMLAQLYEQAQNQELNVLSGVLPTLQQEQANKGSWMNDVVGGLEMVGGIGIDAVTAGTLGNPLIAQGAKTLSGGLSQHGAASPNAGGYSLPGFGGNTGAFGSNAPIAGSIQNYTPAPDNMIQPTSYSLPQQSQISGGSLWGGAPMASQDTPFPIDPSGNLNLDQILDWGN